MSEETGETERRELKEGTERKEGKGDKDLLDLLASIRDADSGRERSTLVKDLANELAKNIIVTVILTILIMVAIFEIFVGAINWDDCPVKDVIPMWLVISGSTSCLRYIVAIALALKDNRTGGISHIRATWEVIFSVFWLVWLILGSYWTFSVYDKVLHKQGSAEYCDHLTYVFMLFILIASYAVMALWICGCCFALCFMFK